jgi:uncharacterized membrane protein YccC
VAAGLRVFGLPVAAFVGFFLGAGPVLQTTTEAPRVLAGLAGSLLAAGAAFAWGRLRPALPEIIRAVDDVDTKGA